MAKTEVTRRLPEGVLISHLYKRIESIHNGQFKDISFSKNKAKKMIRNCSLRTIQPDGYTMNTIDIWSRGKNAEIRCFAFEYKDFIVVCEDFTVEKHFQGRKKKVL